MQPYVPIIETKLVPPAIKDSYIYRLSVIKKMKGLTSYPVTIIHGGAGYGKSTVVSQFVRQCKLPVCWYTVTDQDDDIFPFIKYVTYSIRKHLPLFGEELLQTMDKMDYWMKDDQLQLLSALFINECLNVNKEFVIVIDDFQLVDHAFMINQWIEKVLSLIPNNVHFLFSTRTKPKWNMLIKLKVSGGLLEIGEDDLMLSEEESSVFLTDFHQSQMTDRQLKHIHKLTEGWIIALNMIGSQLTESKDIDSVLKHTHSSMKELFDYLAQEVFNKQSPILQQFLIESAIFNELEPEICDVILGINGSHTMLEQLFVKNIFIQKLEGNKYRFHALFKAFLKRRGMEEQQTHLQVLFQKCARYLEGKNRFEEAMLYYDELKDERAIATILLLISERMIQGRQLETLLERLQSLSEQTKHQQYSLWFFEGEVWRYRSYYDRAFTCYQHAIDAGKKGNDFLLLSKANEGMANIYLDTIQPGKAERYLAEAVRCLEKIDGDQKDKDRLYRMLAENLVNSGQGAKALIWYQKSEMDENSWIEGNLDARMLLRTGKIEEAKKLLNNRTNANNPHLPQAHRETELLLSLLESFCGNGEEAKQLAQKGIQQGIDQQSAFIEACGWIRMGHAVGIMSRYEEKMTIICYETALQLMDSIKVERGKAEPYMGLCVMYGRKGEWEKAKELGERALYETERVTDFWLSAIIKMCIGVAAFYSHYYDDSKQWLEDALASFKQCGDLYGEMLSAMWISLVAQQSNDKELFIEHVYTFLQKVQLGNYEFIFTERTMLGPKDLQQFLPLLVEARNENIHQNYISKLLASWGYAHIDSHPGYTLRVNALGDFQVSLGDRVLDDVDWQREKGKELFQYFLIRKNHLMRKEEILDDLWPDGEEKNSNRDFKVAFNALNKAIEPNRKPRAQTYFILRQDSSYGLNKRAVINYDVDQFEQWIEEGLKEKSVLTAKQLLEKGLGYYKGDFLHDRRAYPWIIVERERLKQLFLQGSEKLARLHIRLNEFDEAIRICKEILIKEATWEEAYRLLMYGYYQKNNRPQALLWYKECVRILNEELDVEPMEATKQMYKMIRNEDVSLALKKEAL
ncbi:BTAD domain-containing putative transcriptional regulator [Metabacillus litoralis]|uniref:BTAD domain-containing putative transcriptional regulator n=1 Tax=Metabacillus litoralis TaxID=152268 RepID=UPI001CFE5456|nr:BTAD domain-containing putative transcriptional regulator [Metabacillus litoralis]